MSLFCQVTSSLALSLIREAARADKGLQEEEAAAAAQADKGPLTNKLGSLTIVSGPYLLGSTIR